MARFDGILLTADFDRTLTDFSGNIPGRNIEAIRYFMENGGRFTVNTGRSIPFSKVIRDSVPCNAPMLCYNGALAYENGRVLFSYPIDLPMGQTLRTVCQAFPQFDIALHGLEAHYHFQPEAYWKNYIPSADSIHRYGRFGEDYGPFIKFNVCGGAPGEDTRNLFSGSAEEIAELDTAQAFLEDTFGDKLVIYRSGARMLNIQAKGTSKAVGARRLQKILGCHHLVCVGDEGNDLPMLLDADFAYCPADGRLADRFETVCACAEGALADVIYEKLPAIL